MHVEPGLCNVAPRICRWMGGYLSEPQRLSLAHHGGSAGHQMGFSISEAKSVVLEPNY